MAKKKTEEPLGLIEGKVEAAARSTRSGKTVYLIENEDGFITADYPLPGSICKFVRGAEKPVKQEEINGHLLTLEKYNHRAAEVVEPVDEVVELQKANLKKIEDAEREKRRLKKAESTRKNKRNGTTARKELAKKTAHLPEKTTPTVGRGTGFALTQEQWDKFDALVKKANCSSAHFIKSLVIEAIK